MTDDVLGRIDRYLDGIARAATRAEPIGSFTLFVQEGPGWPYYARPTPGATSFAADDVAAVRERQRGLGIPESFEWVVDLSPGASEAIASGGLRVTERPLLASSTDTGTAAGVDVRFTGADDDLASIMAVQHVGFEAEGTEVGDAGLEALRGAAAAADVGTLDSTRERIADGRTILASVWVDGGPVAAGAHQPLDGVTEIVGVATLPAYRRRGLGAALTAALVSDARARGADLVFLSAGDDAVARVYARVGFTRVGTFADAIPQ
jgi:ribosomal protein S18 acetylase RimI-like enzyme